MLECIPLLESPELSLADDDSPVRLSKSSVNLRNIASVLRKLLRGYDNDIMPVDIENKHSTSKYEHVARIKIYELHKYVGTWFVTIIHRRRLHVTSVHPHRR